MSKKTQVKSGQSSESGKSQKKKVYCSPELTYYGDVRDTTLGSSLVVPDESGNMTMMVP